MDWEIRHGVIDMKSGLKVQAAKGKAEAPAPSNKPVAAAQPKGEMAAPVKPGGNPKPATQPPAATTKPPAAGQGKPAGPPKPDAGPPPPEPLPEGPSPELENAYKFLQDYTASLSQGINPGPVPIPDVGAGSPLDQIGNLLPKTVQGGIKNYPNFSPAAGSTPSPQLPTGVMPSDLVGGLDRKQVALNQIPLPISKT